MRLALPDAHPRFCPNPPTPTSGAGRQRRRPRRRHRPLARPQARRPGRAGAHPQGGRHREPAGAQRPARARVGQRPRRPRHVALDWRRPLQKVRRHSVRRIQGSARTHLETAKSSAATVLRSRVAAASLTCPRPSPPTHPPPPRLTAANHAKRTRDPEVLHFALDMPAKKADGSVDPAAKDHDSFVIVASDGVWEFITSQVRMPLTRGPSGRCAPPPSPPSILPSRCGGAERVAGGVRPRRAARERDRRVHGARARGGGVLEALRGQLPRRHHVRCCLLPTRTRRRLECPRPSRFALRRCMAPPESAAHVS